MNVEQINDERKRQKLSIAELANKANLPKSTVEKILFGIVKHPRVDTLTAIEHALELNKINPALKSEVELNDDFAIPLLGSVVAGVPIETQPDLEGYIYISHRPAEEYFALRVHGDSMQNAGIPDKCIVVCHKQETAENGEIVVAMVNGEETVKRYKVYDNNIYLMPENPSFAPIPIKEKDELIIFGKVIEVRIML